MVDKYIISILVDAFFGEVPVPIRKPQQDGKVKIPV